MPDDATNANAQGTPAEPSAETTKPQAGSSGTTATASNTGTPAEPAAGTPSSEHISLEEARKLRAESASLRKRLAEFEAEKQAAETAKLSDAEKAAKRLAELEQTNTAQARELTELKVTRAIERTAAALNIVSPDAASKLLDWAEIEFDDSGTPKNLPKLLESLLQTYPFLASNGGGQQQPGQPQQPMRPAASSGGATAPGANARTGGSWTRAQIAAMSPAEYQANRAAIQEAMNRGLITS